VQTPVCDQADGRVEQQHAGNLQSCHALRGDERHQQRNQAEDGNGVEHHAAQAANRDEEQKIARCRKQK